MTKKEKQDLIKKIIKYTDENTDEEHFIHQLMSDTSFYNIETEEKTTCSQKAADGIAKFAGSWLFIICFSLGLIIWIIFNIYLANVSTAFDPYPFVLLNLVLSCIAAIQAPLVMMSQNRQEEKDRQRAKEEYKINLKSEIIIEDMHYKLDKIIENQERIISKTKRE